MASSLSAGAASGVSPGCGHAAQAVAWLLTDPAADPDLGPCSADELARDPGPADERASAIGPAAESAAGAASVPGAA